MIDFIEYKRSRAYAVKIIKTKTRESYINFVESINKQSNMKYAWNKVRILKNANCKVSWNSWPIGQREEAIIEKINKIAPLWVESKRINTKNLIDEVDKYGFNEDFTTEEIKRAFKKTRNKVAPGLDYIDNEMIKNLPDSFM